MEKKWIVIGTGLGVSLGAFALVVDWMTRYAYDRKSPKLPKFLVNTLMGKGSENEEEMKKIRKQAEQLKAKADVTVRITSFDGIEMTGHYYPARHAKRIVIACHGWRSGWNYDYRTIAPFLNKNDTSVLMVDMRGHGESGGRYLYYGKKERFDLACWSQYAAENLAEGLPIYVMGMSAGALAAFMSSTAGLHENTKGIIVDSCAGSARALGMSVVKNLGINPRILYPFIRLDARIRLGMDDNTYTASDAAKKNQLPVLFIHGTEDQVADIHSMEKLYGECSSPKFKLLVKGAGHMQSCFVEPERYGKALTVFFSFCEGRGKKWLAARKKSSAR